VAFTPDERSVLTTIARMIAQALSRAHLHESERALSDVLRRTMLPDERPSIDGMSLAARYVPTATGTTSSTCPPAVLPWSSATSRATTSRPPG
jgi:hypothetical protein